MLQTEKRNQENDLLQLNVHDASMKQFEALLRSNSRTISGNNLDEQKLDESQDNSEE